MTTPQEDEERLVGTVTTLNHVTCSAHGIQLYER